MAVLRQEALPHPDVAVFHLGEPHVQMPFFRVFFGIRECPIEECGVRLVSQVVEPALDGLSWGLGRGGHGPMLQRGPGSGERRGGNRCDPDGQRCIYCYG